MAQNRFFYILPLLLVMFIDTLGTAFIIPLLGPIFIDSSTSIILASEQVRNILYGVTLGVYSIATFFSAPILGDLSDMNIVEAIDMENEYTFFEGFHKFYVYVANRSSEKFKASYGDGESGARLTATLNRDQYAPSFIRNLRRPRPRPR